MPEVRRNVMTPLEKVERCPDLQIRTSINKERVEEFRGVLDKLPSWRIVETDDHRLLLSDGYHRYEAFVAEGQKEAPCDIETGDLKRALEIAIEANCKGPLNLSRDEKRGAVDKALRFFPERANSRLAEMVGVSMQLVDGIRQQLEESKVIPKLETFETRDGRFYPRGTKKLEKPGDTSGESEGIIRSLSEIRAKDDARRQQGDTPPDLLNALYGGKEGQKRVGKVEGTEKARSTDWRSLFVDPTEVLSAAVSDSGEFAVGVAKRGGGLAFVVYAEKEGRFFPIEEMEYRVSVDELRRFIFDCTTAVVS